MSEDFRHISPTVTGLQKSPFKHRPCFLQELGPWPIQPFARFYQITDKCPVLTPTKQNGDPGDTDHPHWKWRLASSSRPPCRTYTVYSPPPSSAGGTPRTGAQPNQTLPPCELMYRGTLLDAAIQLSDRDQHISKWNFEITEVSKVYIWDFRLMFAEFLLRSCNPNLY